MTKEEFDRRLGWELTPTENALITFNIYYNPIHVGYFEMYKEGKYNECHDYLMKNRQYLIIKHTPIGWRKIAKKAIQVSKAFYRNKNK